MTNKMAIWEQLGKTDPSHTKTFKRAGGFSGTAIKPIYTTQKMTEVFGPAGEGWGMGEPTFQTVNGSDGQVAVYCTVSMWHGKRDNVVYGVGGDMVVVKQSSGLRTDDEAFKKAFTDAMSNAMKHLGMSADVHMGLFDDSKYVQEVAAEVQSEKKEASKAKSRGLYAEMQQEVDVCSNLDELRTLWASKAFQDEFKTLPKDWQEQLTERKDARKEELSGEGGAAYVPPKFD